MDVYGYYGGNWYYTCFGLMGVSCPNDGFDDCVEDLITCVTSIQFSQDYINTSQYSGLPLDDNETIKKNMATVGSVIYQICTSR